VFLPQLYEMFMGPLEATKPWQSAQLMGVVRFRDRVFNLVRTQCAISRGREKQLSSAALQGELQKDTHRMIKKVTGDIEAMAFNTAISNLMIYTNTLVAASRDGTVLPRETLESLVLLLSPFAPHVAEECWQLLGHSGTLAYAPWPEYDDKLCAVEKVTLTLLVNGKARGALEVDANLGDSGTTEGSGANEKQNSGAGHTVQAQLVAQALTQERVAAAVGDKEIKKVIYVPGKVLNLIV
jgi:leucyl-tRNA synthetase